MAADDFATFEATAEGVQRLLAAAERNLADARLEALSAAAVAECLARADALFAHTRRWLKSRRPDLLSGKA